jgi:hypothetical protein
MARCGQPAGCRGESGKATARQTHGSQEKEIAQAWLEKKIRGEQIATDFLFWETAICGPMRGSGKLLHVLQCLCIRVGAGFWSGIFFWAYFSNGNNHFAVNRGCF